MQRKLRYALLIALVILIAGAALAARWARDEAGPTSALVAREESAERRGGGQAALMSSSA